MNDNRLRQQQRHNELKAFITYERKLRNAYARCKDPKPKPRMEDSSR